MVEFDRPELVSDPTKDYAVSAVDPYESSLQPQHPTNSASSHASISSIPSIAMEVGGGQGLMEGKGMLSWNLAEKREGTTWVCGRVVSNDTGRGGGRRDKRRKTDDDEDDGEREDDEDEESEDEGVKETLEVWLQLVEVSFPFPFSCICLGLRLIHVSLSQRPSFTQTQFLTSLRSFANPAQQPQPSSDRPSSPPPRRRPLPPGHQQLSRQPSIGDPVKRRRPRDAGQLPRQPIASTSAGPPVDALASLQDPQVLALLSQLLPSLGIGAPQPSTSSPAPTAFALDTPQGRALLPAIRTLAKFYGVAVPENASVEDAFAPSMNNKGKGREVVDSSAPFSNLNAPSSFAAAPPSAQGAAPLTKKAPPRRKAGRAKSRDEAFVAVAIVSKGNHNPMDPDGGCSNCPRKKSAVWREGESQDGITVTVCNGSSYLSLEQGVCRSRSSSSFAACGTYFNKNNHHRTTDRTSPVKANPAKLATVAGRRSVSNSSAGRPLQGRLTATCEADLKKAKKRRSKGPGIVPPPSPSKHIGPRGHLLSPGTHFRHAVSGSRPFLTSPGRSPRRSSRNFGAATSPTGRSTGAGLGLGLRSGYRSDGEERGGMDYTSIFGAPNSPSPTRHHPAMPSYLLTASPGTALARILSDTSVEHFDMPMGDARDNIHATTSGNDNDLSFYIRSSPDEKENAVPMTESGLMPNALTTSLPAASSTTDDYDSLVSSLRRDFNARLSSSNGLTAPSSPTPSSPCVQPRTSSATPGQKGKAPASCGRPAPSILDSFIDTLVPAFALNAVDTPSDSDAWTPASMGDQDLDRTLMQLDHGATSDGGASTYSFSHRHPPIPFHLTTRLTATSPDYDFGGSLPPSSPPALPSEANPTPSEFDSGVTPDEEGYLESGDDAYRLSYEDPTTRQDAVAALLQSLGATSASSGNAFGGGVAHQPGGDMVSLDRSTVAQLLQMISAGGGHHQQHAPPPPPPVEEPSPFDASGFDAFGGKEDVAPPEAELQQDTQLHDLYQSLFSDTAGFGNM